MTIDCLSCGGGTNSFTGSTTYVALASYTVAANTFPANGCLEVEFLASRTGNAGQATLEVFVDGQAFSGNVTLAANANQVAACRMKLYANGATNLQIAYPGGTTNNGLVTPYASQNNPIETGAIDFTSDVTIEIKGKVAFAPDTVGVVAYDITQKS